MDRIRCFLRKKKRGSLTVEASIVFPIAIMLVCLTLWASMLLHDRVCAAAWVCDQTQRAAFQKESGAGQAEQIAGIFTATGLALVEIAKDLAGINRCVILKKEVAK